MLGLWMELTYKTFSGSKIVTFHNHLNDSCWRSYSQIRANTTSLTWRGCVTIFEPENSLYISSIPKPFFNENSFWIFISKAFIWTHQMFTPTNSTANIRENMILRHLFDISLLVPKTATRTIDSFRTFDFSKNWIAAHWISVENWKTISDEMGIFKIRSKNQLIFVKTLFWQKKSKLLEKICHFEKFKNFFSWIKY